MQPVKSKKNIITYVDYESLVIEIQLSKDKIHVMSFSHECIKFIAKNSTYINSKVSRFMK